MKGVMGRGEGGRVLQGTDRQQVRKSCRSYGYKNIDGGVLSICLSVCLSVFFLLSLALTKLTGHLTTGLAT